MLNRRNLIILAVVVVVLMAVSLLQQRSHEERTSQPSSDVLLAGTFTPDDLGRITLGQGDRPEAVVLASQPDGWVVATAWDAAASDRRIDSLLQSLSQLRGEFRSDSPDVLADYGFTDSTTVLIRGYDRSDQLAFALDVGEKPDRGAGCFVKLPDQSAVYLTGESLLADLGLYQGPGVPQAKQFLDLQAYQVDKQAVDTITLHDGDQTIALEKVFPEPAAAPADSDTTAAVPAVDRSTWEWRLTAPRRTAAAKTKVDGLLATASSIRAQDVVDPDVDPATYGLADPAKRVVLTLADGTTVTLDFGQSREAAEGQAAGVYFRVAGEPTVWVVGDWTVKSLFKSVDDLLPTE